MKETIKEAIRLLTIASENLEDIDIFLNEKNEYLLNRTREILAEVIEDLGRLLKVDSA